jgi:hypothetical protein
MARGTATIAGARHRSALNQQPQNTQNTQIRYCGQAPAAAGMISLCVICVICSSDIRGPAAQPSCRARGMAAERYSIRQPRSCSITGVWVCSHRSASSMASHSLSRSSTRRVGIARSSANASCIA